MEDPIIPEFSMFRHGLDESEKEELSSRLKMLSKVNKDRVILFTDILVEYVGSGEWKNHSDAFLAMCAKASFLRGKYGYNQILARQTQNLTCKGYAAAAYCRQSLDPRWLNNLRNITNQAWQAKEYITFSELSGELASVLMDIGYADHARDVISESIERVTKETAQSEEIRTAVQTALIVPRIILAYISGYSESRDEALVRLDSAEHTAKMLDNRLALADILYYRAQAYEDEYEHNRALPLARSAIREYEKMGFLFGVSNARNLRGVIHLNMGQFQEARDQFEEVLLIQQHLNNQVGLARTLINVGEIDRALNQLEQMETYNRRALEISQEAEYQRGIAVATVNLGDVALRKGNIREALKLYDEVIKLTEGTGMKQSLALTYFLVGDAHFALEEFEKAMENYILAYETSKEIGYQLYAFNALASQVVTSWSMKEEPDNEVLGMVMDALGEKEIWDGADDSSQMIEVKRRIIEDPHTSSDLCVFYDGEKSFECRVERTGFRKECFGNLFWKGGLCPYFQDFLSKI